jgi:hypothetical protein
MTNKIEWQPISTAPHDPNNRWDQPRLMLWLPERKTDYGPRKGRAVYGRYESDLSAKNPRPYWRYEDFIVQSSMQRAHQPTHWAPEPDGPKLEMTDAASCGPVD